MPVTSTFAIQQGQSALGGPLQSSASQHVQLSRLQIASEGIIRLADGCSTHPSQTNPCAKVQCKDGQKLLASQSVGYGPKKSEPGGCVKYTIIPVASCWL